MLLTGGDGSNTGIIMGGGGNFAGSGVSILRGSFSNLSIVTGGTGSYNAGAGASLTDGTLVNGMGGAITGGFGEGGGATVGGVGVYVDGGSFFNDGTVTGGGDLPGQKVGDGGAGLIIRGGDALNAGAVIGGAFDAAVGYSGTAGAGVTLSAGTLLNTGDLLGGSGTSLASGSAGIGAIITGGTLFNQGLIEGGATDHTGAAGVTIAAGSLNNSGTILGGGGTFNTRDAFGGDGVDLFGASRVTNSGLIMAGHDAVGARIDGAYLDNVGSIGNVVVTNGGNLLNTGTIGNGGGSAVYVDGGTLTNAGILIAAGGTAVQFGGVNSLLVVDPGAVFDGAVAANAGANDTIALATGAPVGAGTLDMGGSFSGFAAITFDPGAVWYLSGSSSELAAGQTIDGFSTADTLVLEGFAATSDHYIAGRGLVLENATASETLDITGSFDTLSFQVKASAAGTEVLLCYLRGTRLLTPAGEVPVEQLAIGDTLITRCSGYRRIKWIGRQSFGARFINGNRDQMPVRIEAGALGAGLPKRELWVSPGHAMLLGGVLVVARNLVNGVTITQDEMPDEVFYYQVEFETHDCVMAEGSWSESFCDYGGLRNQFHNVAEFWARYPDHVTPDEHRMCAPRPETGAALAAAMAPLAAHAAARVSPGALQGWVDEVAANGTIRGWARDVVHPDLPVLLEVWRRDRRVGSTVACDYRTDLNAAAIGRCAFTLRVPKLTRDARKTIQIRRTGDGAVLPLSQPCETAVGAATSRFTKAS